MKYICKALLLILCSMPLFSLEVDRLELESAGDETSVIFVNYEGPHDVINTIEEIESIGSGLALPISEARDASQNVGDANRYYVIHAVDPENPNGLDADILILGENANVDHIDNVRRIISSYLQSAYDYSADDAQTIAVFTTVYNAVYRGQMDVFTEKYKPIVIENLTASKVGISLNYDEWAGNTQIVIPLASLEGGLGTVDTGIISDPEVVESMQEDPGKGIEDRKDLVEIKEEEAEIAEEKAQEAQKEATVAKQEVVEEKQVLQEVKEEAEVAQQKAEENPDDPVAQKEAEVAQEKVEEQEKVVEQAEQKVIVLQDEAEEQQDIADTKRTDAQSDRVEIAEDQQEIIRERAANGDEILILTHGLKIVDDSSLLSTLVLIDTKSGIEVKESPVNVIRNRTVYSAGEDYIAVAGTTGGNAAVRLVKLDSLDMDIIDQSEEKLAIDSVLVKDGDFYYVVIEDGNKNVVAKYDPELNQVLKSDVDVLPQTPITITDLGIMVTDKDGIAKLLDAETLLGIENLN